MGHDEQGDNGVAIQRPVRSRIGMNGLGRSASLPGEAAVTTRRPPRKVMGGDKERAARQLAARAERPLTERQSDVLKLLNDGLLSSTDVASKLSLKRSSAQGALYSLAARDLVRKLGDGRWEAL